MYIYIYIYTVITSINNLIALWSYNTFSTHHCSCLIYLNIHQFEGKKIMIIIVIVVNNNNNNNEHTLPRSPRPLKAIHTVVTPWRPLYPYKGGYCARKIMNLISTYSTQAWIRTILSFKATYTSPRLRLELVFACPSKRVRFILLASA